MVTIFLFLRIMKNNFLRIDLIDYNTGHIGSFIIPIHNFVVLPKIRDECSSLSYQVNNLLVSSSYEMSYSFCFDFPAEFFDRLKRIYPRSGTIMEKVTPVIYHIGEFNKILQENNIYLNFYNIFAKTIKSIRK